MQYNLIVVSPFLNFKNGDIIKDQKLIAKILDVNDDHHAFESNVRRIKALYKKPELKKQENVVPAVVIPAVANNKPVE